MPEKTPSFYTVNEAAELLKVCPGTIRNLIKRKEIDYYKVGQQIRIHAAEIERLKVPAQK